MSFFGQKVLYVILPTKPFLYVRFVCHFSPIYIEYIEIYTYTRVREKVLYVILPTKP